MATLAKKTDYATEATSRMLGQFVGKPRLNALLQSFMGEVQAVEDALYSIYLERELQTSPAPTGDLLAKLGKIVGQGSLGLVDAQYLLLIMARIAVNKSGGRFTDIVNVVQLLYGPPIPAPINVLYFDYAPASYVVIPQSAAVISPWIVEQQFIGPATAAGVTSSLIWSPAAPNGTITWGSVHASGFSATVPPSDPTISSGQFIGSSHHATFAAGPPPSNAGGGVFAGVVTDTGAH